MAIAPAMTKDKTLPHGGASFEKLNDPCGYTPANVDHRKGSYEKEPLRIETLYPVRDVFGDGNVAEWSESNLDAVRDVCSIFRNHYADVHDVVYVVGTLTAECVKVGMAVDPVKRLAQLQTGNPSRLYLHRAFWTLSKDSAQLIEARAHSFLRRKCNRLTGEWFYCPPTLAHETIVNTFRSAGSGFIAITPYGGNEIKHERII